MKTEKSQGSLSDTIYEGRWFHKSHVREAVKKLKNKILTWSATRTKRSSPKRREIYCIFDMDDIDELTEEIDKIFGEDLK